MFEEVVIGEDSPNSGGKYDPTARRVFPVRAEFFHWHQGSRAEWQRDDYAEFVIFDNDPSPSLVSRDANRIRVELSTEFTNRRSYHDWKGYDSIDPIAYTSIRFNGRQIYETTAYPGDTLRHLMAVNKAVEDLKHHYAFGWWQDKDIEKVWGMSILYKGWMGTVKNSEHLLSQGCVMLSVPELPSDDYYQDGEVKVNLLDKNIQWYV